MKAGWWEAPLALRVLAVSNLPQFPPFSKSQLTSPAHNLVISLPHRFYMPISWQRKNIFGTSGESNQVFCGGSSTSQPPCYILRVCYKFHRFFDATPPQSRNNLGYTLLSSHCTRHFSLPHHAPIFSRIHPLSGQGRHFWQIGSYPWKLTCEMLPCPPGFSHEQCTWYF